MKFIALSMIAFVFLISSCGGNNGSSTFEDEVVDTDTIVEVVKPVEPEISTYDQVMNFIDTSKNKENYMNGIIPAIAKEKLDYALKLLKNKHQRFIIVDKATMNVILYNKFGEIEKKYKMACARYYGDKRKKADNRTPEGYFTVEGIYDSTEWLFTDDNGYTSPKKGQFGPRFIRIAPQIGIHGTVAPWSVGSRASHGCIRLTNENILDLVKYAEAGMPVIVNPGSRDLAVNIEEGYPSVSITTIPGVAPAKPAVYSPSFIKGGVVAKESAEENDSEVEAPEGKEVKIEENKVENIPDSLTN